MEVRGRVAAVIPARWNSRRFPGKPLVPILGRPMVARVIAAAQQAQQVDAVILATDDERIAQVGEEAGAIVCRTHSGHATGTDRAAEAVDDLDVELVLSLQGDEPMLAADSVDRLASAFADESVDMATLAVRGVTDSERNDPGIAKIVTDDENNALYFSRAPIPYRNVAAGARELGEQEREPGAWRHVGTYGFRKEALTKFAAESRRGLEALEDLEQLRALRLGWRIRVVEVEESPICVDVPADVAKVESVLRARGERES